MNVKPRLLVGALVVLVLAWAAVRWLGSERPGPAAQSSTAAAEGPTVGRGELRPPVLTPPSGPARAQGTAAPAAAAPLSSTLLVRNVVVKDLDGRPAWRGDVDLAPVLARIEAGQRDPHRNDGGIFGNREGLLRAERRGYYHEYVIRTPGLSGPGPQRLVLGSAGEVYYSPDHYATFRRVR